MLNEENRKEGARMEKISFFDTKPYDRIYFEQYKEAYGFSIEFYEEKLNPKTAFMAAGSKAAVAFVNDTLDQKVMDTLAADGVEIVGMRCAGYNNVDFKAAFGRIHVVRVPAYSPYAVAEHAMAMLLMLNRKLHRAYNRTREYNFSLNGLTGFDLHGKTIGVVGTGKIGRVFIDICHGFGMRVLAYDPFPAEGSGIDYVSMEELCRQSDIISLHCPLTKETYHIINEDSLSWMKEGVYLINTSRGALIDSEALLAALKSGHAGAAGLDVYEEETEFFYEDFSNQIIQDDTLARLISLPNVLVTSHQAFLTREALSNIAETTLKNLRDYFDGKPLDNEICYHCSKNASCKKNHKERCF